jgi:CRISPR/Cas system CMR subunit Cmr4 (Cas7 group RAMP superfamily)
VNSIKEAFHPNAYLQHVKNVKSGLEARTKILEAIEKRVFVASSIAAEKSLSYGVVMHHLRLLENEGTVNRKGKRPYFWLLTGLGQKRLIR